MLLTSYFFNDVAAFDRFFDEAYARRQFRN
jgi:hypothetical protein